MFPTYTLRKLTEGTEPTTPRTALWTILKLRFKLRNLTTGPWHLVIDGEPGPRHGRIYKLEAQLRSVMTAVDRRIVVRSGKGPDFLIKRIPPKFVVVNTAGTRGIDIIHAAVTAYCRKQNWDVRELGICADKPGEHGYCNAWDAGCTNDGPRYLPSAEIHRRITIVASYLRDEGVRYAETAGRFGLPVNGVIVMSQYWERGMGQSWRYYSGTPHVSHWHVSAHPSFTGWV